MDLDAVLAETPRITTVPDERVRFYLANRSLIETWAALRSEAASALTEGMLDLAGPLAEDMAKLGEPETQVLVSASRGRASIDITRPAWRTDGGVAPVQVSLETESTSIDQRGTVLIFPCVRAKQSHVDADAWRGHLNGLAPVLRASMGRGWKSSPPRYVVWKYVDASQENWDLEDILLRAREDVLRLWIRAAPLLERLYSAPHLSDDPAAP